MQEIKVHLKPEAQGEIKELEEKDEFLNLMSYSLVIRLLMESFYLLPFLEEDDQIMWFVFHVGLSKGGKWGLSRLTPMQVPEILNVSFPHINSMYKQ